MGESASSEELIVAGDRKGGRVSDRPSGRPCGSSLLNESDFLLEHNVQVHGAQAEFLSAT